MNFNSISRKNFLKLIGVGITGYGLQSATLIKKLVDFPNYERLGRVCILGMVEIKSQPSDDSQTVGVLYEDAVVPWIKDVVAKEPNYNLINQRWVETPDGYIYAANLQPVRNLPNIESHKLISTTMGEGLWAEVTVPYVDVALVNNPSSNSWVRVRLDHGLPLRAYYGQVYYVDKIKSDDQGNKFYRVNPNYYGGVDMFWVPAEAMHTISGDEISPISPDVESKKIIVDVNKQTLSCYEGDSEIYYCQVSTGWFDVSEGPSDDWGTPLGSYLISRKFISLQMNGSTTGAPYDYPGIGWVSVFASGGVAIHGTFWHNKFGSPQSHGCVNALPEDAKWIFRWTQPPVYYDTGLFDISITNLPSTVVQVIYS